MNNTDITVIIPMHRESDDAFEMLENAINSVEKCRENYENGTIYIKIVAPFKPKSQATSHQNTDWCINTSGDNTYCGQVNFAVSTIETPYFSILEYDDTYKEKWFKFFSQYLYGNEEVSVFVPVNVVTDKNGSTWRYANEMPLASYFSSEIGFIDFDCLQDWSSFTLAGSVFNTKDFKSVGMFKPSIKLASDYEFLLRLTNKKLKVMVVPKEGYKHIIGVEGSLLSQYKDITDDEIQKWFDLAKREYLYDEDRKKGISIKKSAEEIK